MRITFPAMRAHMGGREYYLTTMALSEIPRFFKFNDWEAVTPELRAQRVLNESRVPAIAKYIVDHEDGYLFSSITCSYSADLQFVPSSPNTPDNGQISLDLEQMEFVINDGQHRCAAIATALKECPSIAHDRISVLFFPMESLERMQQMFSDLNRYAQRTSKSLNILYDQRDPLAALTMEVVEQVDVFRGMVDFERISIPIRSAKLFALTAIYDANQELLGRKDFSTEGEEFNNLVAQAVQYWTAVAQVIPDWVRVSKGELQAPAVRQEKISTHSIVMRALGGAGWLLLQKYPNEWREHLKNLRDIDWRKSVGSKVNPLWDGVCITAGSVVSNRQARLATLSVLASCVGAGEGVDGDKLPSKRRGRPPKAEAA
jgi:DNA sulfur modification protein DndB